MRVKTISLLYVVMRKFRGTFLFVFLLALLVGLGVPDARSGEELEDPLSATTAETQVVENGRGPRTQREPRHTVARAAWPRHHGGLRPIARAGFLGGPTAQRGCACGLPLLT